jgi:metal-sulfur cluster biosynthetic enzyme
MKVPLQMPLVPAHAGIQTAEERFGQGERGAAIEAALAGSSGLPIKPQSKVDAVWAALRDVSDPELDQSVVDLGFISEVRVNGDAATVAFRLPTFWCSTNFAWIMAEDMRLALRALPWLRRADIRLIDHFAADRINAGIADGKGFRETFAGEAGGDLAGLRATFRRKAFLGRMSALIEALRARGWSDKRIVTVCIADLAPAAEEPGLTALVLRYVELRAFFGGSSRPDDIAVRTADGDPISAINLPAYLRDIRMTRRGVEANGEMCRILLAERYLGRVSEQAGAELKC